MSTTVTPFSLGGAGGGEQSKEILKIGNVTLPFLATQSALSSYEVFTWNEDLYLYLNDNTNTGFFKGDFYKYDSQTRKWTFVLNYPFKRNAQNAFPGETFNSSKVQKDSLIHFVENNGDLYVFCCDYWYKYDGEGSFDEFEMDLAVPLVLSAISYNDEVYLLSLVCSNYRNQSDYWFPVLYKLVEDTSFNKLAQIKDSFYTFKSSTTNSSPNTYTPYPSTNYMLFILNEDLYVLANSSIKYKYDEEKNVFHRMKNTSFSLGRTDTGLVYKNKLHKFSSSNGSTLASTHSVYLKDKSKEIDTFGVNTFQSKAVVYEDKVYIIGGTGSGITNTISTFEGDSEDYESGYTEDFYADEGYPSNIEVYSNGDYTYCFQNVHWNGKPLNVHNDTVYVYNKEKEEWEVIKGLTRYSFISTGSYNFVMGDVLYRIQPSSYEQWSFYTLNLVTKEEEYFVAKRGDATSSGYIFSNLFNYKGYIWGFNQNGYLYKWDPLNKETLELVMSSGIPMVHYTAGSSGNTGLCIYDILNVNDEYVYFTDSNITYQSYSLKVYKFNGSSFTSLSCSNPTYSDTTNCTQLAYYRGQLYAIVFPYYTNGRRTSYPGFFYDVYKVNSSSTTKDTSNTLPISIAFSRGAGNLDAKNYSPNCCFNYYKSSVGGLFYKNIVTGYIEFYGDDGEYYVIGKRILPSYVGHGNEASPGSYTNLCTKESRVVENDGELYYCMAGGLIYKYNKIKETWEYLIGLPRTSVSYINPNNIDHQYYFYVSLVSYDNKLYIVTGDKIFRYNSNTNDFTSFNIPNGTPSPNYQRVVVYDDKIHIIKSGTSNDSLHYTFNGSTFDTSLTASLNAFTTTDDIANNIAGGVMFVENDRLNFAYQNKLIYFDSEGWHGQYTATTTLSNTLNKRSVKYEGNTYIAYTQAVSDGYITGVCKVFLIGNENFGIQQLGTSNAVLEASDSTIQQDAPILIPYENELVCYIPFIQKSSNYGSYYSSNYSTITYRSSYPNYVTFLPKYTESASAEPIGADTERTLESEELYTTQINLSEGNIIRGTSICTVDGDATLQEDGTYLVNSTGDFIIRAQSPITIL